MMVDTKYSQPFIASDTKCPVCGKWVVVNKDGSLRVHGYTYNEAGPLGVQLTFRRKRCSGSGRIGA